MKFFEKVKQFRGTGLFLLRFLVGFHLIYGTQDNVFSWEQMLEFSGFLEQFGFPVPLISAVVSVYAQFICGILFIVGYKIRWAALVMIINFIIALLMVHLGDTYPNMFPALVMFVGSVFFLIYGSDKISLEQLREKRR